MTEIIITIIAGSSMALFVIYLTNIFQGSPLRLYLKRKRIKKFNSQLTDAVNTMSNCLKAGLSLVQAVETVEREMEPPISEEFGIVSREHKMGLALEEAIKHLADRIKGDDIQLLVTSITIAHQLGGNLVGIFEQITSTIRARQKIQGRIQTLTAQGKMQGAVVSTLPIGLGLALYLLAPDMLSLLFTTPIGKILVAIFVFLEVSGWLLIRKIVTINV